MENQKFYRQFYEQTGIREEEVDAEERVPVTLAMVPTDIGSVLDLGCGDGTLLRKIDSTLFRTGVDISRTALKLGTTGYRIQASSFSLPFKGGIFDLILCTEVLEHLPSGEYEKTLSEMQRVGNRFILISVPFREDLDRKQARCSACGNVFHIHLHLRNFDLYKLENLFPGYSLRQYRFSGPQERTFPTWLLGIRRTYGNRWEWDKNALCPRCGHKDDNPPKRSLISAMTSLMATLTGEKHPKWVSALYEAI
jgi:SAM-dependent methyltransferase